MVALLPLSSTLEEGDFFAMLQGKKKGDGSVTAIAFCAGTEKKKKRLSSPSLLCCNKTNQKNV
jgi:hypothetical protein